MFTVQYLLWIKRCLCPAVDIGLIHRQMRNTVEVENIKINFMSFYKIAWKELELSCKKNNAKPERMFE